MFRKRDAWLIAGVLALALTAALLLHSARPASSTDAALYVRCTIDGVQRDLQPLTDERDLVIDQGDGCVNVLHLTANSVVMQSATCANQQCVQQGRVTLDNRDLRPLYNLIVCAPHHLTVELLTAEEANAIEP